MYELDKKHSKVYLAWDKAKSAFVGRKFYMRGGSPRILRDLAIWLLVLVELLILK
jgi:hypothetical protein